MQADKAIVTRERAAMDATFRPKEYRVAATATGRWEGKSHFASPRIGPKIAPNAIGVISDTAANPNTFKALGPGTMELLATTDGITIKRQIAPAAAPVDH